MAIVSGLMFRLVDWAARRGIVPEVSPTLTAKQVAARKGVRGETYAYWYLRRKGYVFIARNYTAAGYKGEIDLIGYDGPVLAFVEVKTRTTDSAKASTSDGAIAAKPEDAITADKRRVLSRMARRFLTERRIDEAPWRFDVLAIESAPGRRPVVRLHKDAFAAG